MPTLKELIAHQLACNYPRREAILRAIEAFKLQKIYKTGEKR